ncbi:uncharacterized protein LOC100825992 [Brachypodium distachyon]|uniref:Uncharacterized protein n=1 Tax=Brachypodium distachyon TaxID=15368 RepID=I1H180_BRADI|nr:uncharacterized protein LOC100825992 [Brachypodium distachyon]KQK19700.1 hypothetical protein BRADI_1g49890v3 [Brachypodium distachyon]|eukprot:XP_003561132.1 uncharacterized protein LOC100825992 [Brachypodium distachyon]
MTGKGVRRREKNYRAAHGGDARMPPPPKQRELDALPSKLRRLIAIQNMQSGGGKAGAAASSGVTPGSGKQDADGTGKNKASKDKKTKKQAALETAADGKAAEVRGEGGPEDEENVNADESKRKRKRGKAVDLRFKELDAAVSVSKKQKRKKHLDEKKKKRKGGKVETLVDFPGREKVKFGDIVQAPPKLSFPKLKSPLDASRERIRKEVVEKYRNIKGWTSRPGLQLPTVAEKTSV